MPPPVKSSPLRILYLANYAPLNETEAAEEASESVRYTRYHKEMFGLLKALGFSVTPSRKVESLLNHPTSYDYVFSLLNRAPYRGSEILVSALCEYFRLPYLGARPQIRAVAEDKYVAKLVAKQLGFEVPAGEIFRGTDAGLIPPRFPGPYIVKPRCGASSKNITEDCIQDQWSDLVSEVRRLLGLGDDVLVEEWIPGINISLPVIGGAPPLILPAYQLDSAKKGQLVTYDQKRGLERSLKRAPFDNSAVYDEISRCALRLYSELGPIDYLRLDFRITDSNKPVFLEFNICCNIGPESGFYACAKQTGLSHQEMLMRILAHSFKRQEIDWQSF
ncbi:MAG: D-alanine-D-alanine ligase [Pyrinomonadaceae bacterium]|jgi:D-alanine-D-alanine ligase|nr:D-alanine-D-alanine ligase [Pyrinomonadaceae bacterium]